VSLRASTFPKTEKLRRLVESLDEAEWHMRDIGSQSVLMVLFVLLLVALTWSSAPGTETAAPPTLQGRGLADALRRGGYVVYFRHALTDAAQVDADRPDFSRCETQRNLSDEGRRMAREIGAAFKALSIRVGKVYSSPYCRTAETAKLAFGKYEVLPILYFAVGVEKDERARQSAILRQMLASPPAPQTNTILVGHNANLKEATGLWPKREGDAHVFRPRPAGDFVHVGEATIEDWVRMAREATAAR
jgi:phosphohistidine phosphatase SixA